MPSYLTFADYDHSPEPHQIKAIYDSGFPGIRPEFFLSGPPRIVPRFYQSFPQAVDAGKGKVSLPYKIVLTMEPEYGRYEPQQTGDCVSHGIRNAGMIDYCVDAYFGETKYAGRLACENIYGMRGHGGQGADPNRLSVYVGPEGSGGFLVRKKYDNSQGGSVDLSKYTWQLGHNWGPTGTPTWLNQIASGNKALRVFQCKSKEEARDALASGFGIGAASNYGFSSQRNQDGLAEQTGSWAHEQCWCGYDDSDYAHQKYGGGLALMVNSWGANWISGPKRFEQPDGSYFIRPQIADSYARQGGLFAFCAVRGYDRQLVYDQMSMIEKACKG